MAWPSTNRPPSRGSDSRRDPAIAFPVGHSPSAGIEALARRIPRFLQPSRPPRQPWSPTTTPKAATSGVAIAPLRVSRPPESYRNPAAPTHDEPDRLPPAGSDKGRLPLWAHRMRPRPHATATDAALAAGESPFELARLYTQANREVRLSKSALSAWSVYVDLCTRYNRPPLPLTVDGLVGFMLGYVRVRGNSSANLSSEMSSLAAFARAQVPPLTWPDFLAESGEKLVRHIERIQTDWPAEVRPAPELTYEAGLSLAVAYLNRLPPTLWSLQWSAIASLMHALVLRPSDIIPLDEFPVAEGTTSAFAFPRRGDFDFVPAEHAPPDGELHYRNALHKMNKRVIDYRTCVPATLGLGADAEVNAPRSLRTYLEAAGLWDAPPNAPIFFYRARDGSPRGRMSRSAILSELREHILAPAGVADWARFELRSFRPGGATDLRAAGVPANVVHKVGKWKKKAGLAPYDRANRYMLDGVAPFRDALVARQARQ